MSLSKSLSAFVVTVLACASAQAASITRQPFLQRAGTDRITVAFRLGASCQARVRYGTGGATDREAVSSSTGTHHAVELTGLQAGTAYTYVVDACGTTTAAKTFRTAPPVGTQRVHFVTVGDFGTGDSEQAAVTALMREQKADLFVTLGDNAYESGTESEIQSRWLAPMATLLAEVPMFSSPGNHEYVTNQAQPYLDNLYLPTSAAGGERYYSFDWGFIHFVSLDSSCATGLASSDRCTLSAQRTWAEQDLAATKQPWKVVFFHHPPWSSGEHGSQLTMRREFGPLFEKYGVDLVLTGHDHNYERSKPMKGDGLAPSGTPAPVYLVVGGGGASLRSWPGSQPSWTALRNNTDYGFLDVVVDGGTLTARALAAPGGKVFDSFTLTKSVPPAPAASEPTLDVAVESAGGTTVRFVASTNLSGASVQWDFGDGQEGTGAQVQHAYAAAGAYTVTATASAGSQGATRTASVTVGSGSVSVEGGWQGGEAPAAPEGGCSAAAAGLVPAAALLLVGLARRRRRA